MELRSNSYITVRESVEILLGLFGGEAWNEVSIEVQKRALNTATMRIDTLQNLCGGFIGEKTDDAQILEFPRTTTDNQIPNDVKRATAMEALFIISSADATDRIGSAIKAGLKSKTVGNASESYATASELDNKGMKKYLGSDDAIALMKKYLIFSGYLQYLIQLSLQR